MKTLGMRAVAVGVLAIVACSDDADGPETMNSDAGHGPLDSGTAPPSADVKPDASPGVVTPGGMDAGMSMTVKPSVYLAATRVFSPDGNDTSTHVGVLTSIEAGSKLEVSKTKRYAGSAELIQIPQLGWFGIGDGESPKFTRLTVGNDNQLVEEKSIDLTNYGLSDFFGDKVYFVSPTKVYYPDPDGLQLLIINPTEMRIDGKIDLPQTERTGYTSYYSSTALRRGDKLLFSVGYFDWTNDKILPETTLVTVDTNTNQVLGAVKDERCAGINNIVETTSGDAYLVSSALAGALFKLNRLTVAPCALRVLAGAEAFDAAFAPRLADLTGGRIAGEGIPDSGDSVIFRLLDDSKITIAVDTPSWKVTGQAAWGWVRWNVKTNTVTPIPGIEPSASDAYWFKVGDRLLVSQSTADFSSTQLVEITATGATNVLASEGFFSAIGAVR